MKRLLVLLGAAAITGAVAICARKEHYSFLGKVAVITGGSRGLGLALARELAAQGARVDLIARDAGELQKAAASILGGDVSVWVCDLADSEALARTIREIAESRGQIDLLINNAGVMLVGPLSLMKTGDFEEAMTLHYRAPLHAMRAALPYLKETRGRIVNIASIGGRVAVPHMAAYSASKFALVGLSDAFRAEVWRDGIRVTTVSPGLMRTGSHRNASFRGDHKKEFAWFSLGATLPLVSIAAERAAKRIIAAAAAGRPELTITPQARLLIVAEALFPGLAARAIRLAGLLLPRGNDEQTLKGAEFASFVSPSFLTTLGDRASDRLNETG